MSEINRHEFLKALGALALVPALPRRAHASVEPFRRVRPGDAAWPSPSAWKQLSENVGGNLFPVEFPLSGLRKNSASVQGQQLAHDLSNPFFVMERPGLTQTLGWADAWTSQPSAFCVAARNANDIAAAVNFAREHRLRLVVKGSGHSYKGHSNAPDSLLVWTHHMHDIALHDAFVPKGGEGKMSPLAAVTVGAGTYGMQAYTAVTTKAGKYVQGGGCTTVGLAGLLTGGGFGSFSKAFGSAAGGLLEAEVVTADGQIRIANAFSNPDLYWALKGGGGGTFGVMSRMTLRVHALPEFFGAANFTVKASTPAAFRRLIGRFVAFYREQLFNEHWGEQIHLTPDNTLQVRMVFQGLTRDQARALWQPFLDWAKASPDYSLPERTIIGAVPARHFWDAPWWKEHWPEVLFPADGFINEAIDFVLERAMANPILVFDDRQEARPQNAWWKGDGEQVSEYLWAYESLWLPETLLAPNAQERLADALFESAQLWHTSLHFNKGLAGGRPEAIALAKDTATNPAVLTSFALVIMGDGQGTGTYPGIKGHEPDLRSARAASTRVTRAMDALRKLVAKPAAYFNESNYVEKNWPDAYWGEHYARLASIKKTYDPDGLFYVHGGVGSDAWSADGFTRL